MKKACRDLLRDLQKVSFAWVKRLRSQMQDVTCPSERKEYLCKSVEIALICGVSFDLDYNELVSILSSSQEETSSPHHVASCHEMSVSIIVQCAIMVQEGKRTFNHTTQPVLALLDLRFRRFLHRASSILAASKPGLDDAIRSTWAAYRSGFDWQVVHQNGPDIADTKAVQWITTKTRIDGSDETLTVHYNCLTGELLVNGLPLDRPPKEYESHEMWSTLFGQLAVEVMPTTSPGMQFSAKKQYMGHDVHFTIKRSGDFEDLIVRACSMNATYELIPRRVLLLSFPVWFVTNFVHWYDPAHDKIDFRPTNEAWESSSAGSWKLARCGPGAAWQLMQGISTLIGVNSTTAKHIEKVLSPLAERARTHISLQQNGNRIEIDIPDLRLGFSLGSGQSMLHSRDYRGMQVDEDQRLGTMIGFANKLLLRTSGGHVETIRERMVLLPEGDVRWVNHDGHIQVSVSKPSIVAVHSLRVDARLGRLIDNGDFQCKLYVAYIHALTSFALSDPLTRKTGTQQCLSDLVSGVVRSISHLTKANIGMLERIACLTPKRCFYPEKKRLMQTVLFDNQLSFLSQHGGFYDAVQVIAKDVEQSERFTPGLPSQPVNLPRTNHFLHMRDTIRSSTFRESGFGRENFTVARDEAYDGRTNRRSDQALLAHTVASCVFSGISNFASTEPLPSQHLWKELCTTGTVQSISGASLPMSYMAYDTEFASNGLQLSAWLIIHQQLCGPMRPNKFDMMMWLLALAASGKVTSHTVHILTLLYTSETVSRVALPTTALCSLSEGHDPVADRRFTRLVTPHFKPMANTPVKDVQQRDNETSYEYRQRQESMLSSKQSAASQIMVNFFISRWPSSVISAPTTPNNQAVVSQYIDVDLWSTKHRRASRFGMITAWSLRTRRTCSRRSAHWSPSPSLISCGRASRRPHGPRAVGLATSPLFADTSLLRICCIMKPRRYHSFLLLCSMYPTTILQEQLRRGWMY